MILDSNENKEKILKEFLQICQIEGWNVDSIKKALKNSEIEEKFHSLIFENGIVDLIEFYIDSYNEKMAEEINKNQPDFHTKKIREKIKIAVFTRFLIERENKIAIQRLANFLVNYRNLSINYGANPLFFSLKSCYKIADFIWFFIHDKSTDFNFYSKRLVLSKIILRSIFVFLKDETEDLSKTSVFIDAQIAKVMKFEETKFKIKKFFSDKKETAQNICLNENGDLKSLKNFVKDLPFFRLIKK